MKNRRFRARLGFALAGLRLVFVRETSFRAQAALAAAAALAVLAVRPAPLWTALDLSAAMVLALELVDSALEHLLDHLHPAHSREIGAAKDAAAVLVASLAPRRCLPDRRTGGTHYASETSSSCRPEPRGRWRMTP